MIENAGLMVTQYLLGPLIAHVAQMAGEIDPRIESHQLRDLILQQEPVYSKIVWFVKAKYCCGIGSIGWRRTLWQSFPYAISLSKIRLFLSVSTSMCRWRRVVRRSP